MGFRRTRGGYLHPRNRAMARDVGLEIDKNDSEVLRLQTGSFWDYARLPIELENFHVQNDFRHTDDVDAAKTWTKDHLETGSGESDLALVPSAYDLNDRGWPPRAIMATGDNDQDYICYQANWHSVSWPKDLLEQYANTSDEYWLSHVEFGVSSDGVGGYVPATAFVGWMEEIDNPGNKEWTDFNNGFGWYVSYGHLLFIAKVDGVTTIEMDLTDDIGRPIVNGDLLQLSMGWFPKEDIVMFRMAKNGGKYVTVQALPETGYIMPGNVELKTTLAVLAEMNKSTELQMRFYKYLTPKNSMG